ncbi:MAG: B12-binding domain-containing radical SAM protein [bacterium]
MPPLGLGYVAALTPQDWQIKIVDEHVDTLSVGEEKPDLVGISTYSLNAPRAYQLSEEFRKRGIITILGGIHASMMPSEAENYSDAVVIGEAESVWGKVISDFENNTLKKRYIGERVPLVNLPIPRRDLFSDKYEMDIIQTTRGCPFNCEFCSVSAFNGAEYRQRPVEEVLNELATIKKKLVYFVDDNIFGFGKEAEERAIRLFGGMIDRKFKKIWGTQASINFADRDEVLRYAYKSGCRAVYIGFESIIPDSLVEMKKSINLKAGVEGFYKAIRKIHDHGIGVVGAFIVGNDHDDVTTFKKLWDFMKNVSLDVLSIAYLTPLPGTRLFERLKKEGRIIYDDFPGDWEKYDTDQVVIKPANMSVDELVRGYGYLVNKKFTPSTMLFQSLKTLMNTKNFVTALFAFNLNKGTWEYLVRDRDFDRIGSCAS